MRDNRLYLSSSTGVAALKVADGSPLWSFQVAEPDAARLCSNTIFLTDPAVILCLEDAPPSPPRSTILALSVATGQELWRIRGPATAPGERFEAPALATGASYVYIALPSAHLTALDALTGQQRWSRALTTTPNPLHPPSASPLLAADASAVYIYPVADQQIAALGAHTGAALWQVSPPSRATADVLDALVAPHGGPLLALQTTRDANAPQAHTILALHPSDGTLAWQQTLQDDMGQPLLVDGATICARTGTTLRTLRLGDGQLLAETPLSGVKVDAVVDGVAFGGIAVLRLASSARIGFPPNTIVALDAHTGRQYWRVSVAPLFLDDTVLVA
jgi:outer membrane protein assembly factor BamB